MTLNSMMFFTIFFTFFPLYYISKKWKWVLLLLFNYYFYIIAMPSHVLTILITSISTYIAAIIIEKIKNPKYKKIFTGISILSFLFVLIYFKYSNFLLKSLGFTIDNKIKTLIAPIGISFYTLQVISYLVDVYKGKLKAEKHLVHLLIFVSFFGTILSGPIERAIDFLPQLKKKITLNFDLVFDGLKLVIEGLFLKVAVADKFGVFVDAIYNNPSQYKGYPLILATLLFGLQLYTDFNGYSLMAKGFSQMLGLKIMDNFNNPYFSKSIREFWRRWHISLSFWFRDYVYIPLGGKKVSTLRGCFNRLVVFTVSGLWHGANWTFILWGFLHGFYQSFSLVIHKLFPNKKSAPKLIQIIITYLLANFAWIFFRANTMNDGIYICKNLFRHIKPLNLNYLLNIITIKQLTTFFILIIFIFIIDYIKEKSIKLPLIVNIIIYTIMLLGILCLGNPSESSFIYFNF